jgi:hypothetical protein
MAEATREVVATYRSAEEARTAIRMLERHGVDAERIRMIGTPGLRAVRTDSAMREPDERLTRDVGRRAMGGSVGLAVVAAAVVFLVSKLAFDAAPGAALAFAAGAYMAGGALGFFLGGASRLAVSDEWGESYTAEGPATISVHVPDDAVIDLRDRLQKTHPDQLTVS